MKNNYQSLNLSGFNGTPYIVSLSPYEGSGDRLAHFAISCHLNGSDIELNGTLIDNSETGNIDAEIDGGEDTEEVILEALFNGDYSSMEEVLEDCYSDAIQAESSNVRAAALAYTKRSHIACNAFIAGAEWAVRHGGAAYAETVGEEEPETKDESVTVEYYMKNKPKQYMKLHNAEQAAGFQLALSICSECESYGVVKVR